MTEMMVRIRENMSQILSTNKTLEERLLDFAKFTYTQRWILI